MPGGKVTMPFGKARQRQLDILSTGHPGVEKHLGVVISMLETELDN
jgi:hypothetical protein